MSDIKIVDNKVIYTENLYTCRSCGKPMFGSYSILKNKMVYPFPSHEHYLFDGVCTRCVDSGEHKWRCDQCGIEKLYPKEFQYRLVFYAKYPEGETTYDCICKDCVLNTPQVVMGRMADADETEKL